MSDFSQRSMGAGTEPAIPDHDLIGLIGTGSYGEIWIARSATGTLRAVKVLHRARFGDDQQPFEREFEGLMRFEPVSREHEHVVDVLHIGRGDDVLYYVMELADDADGMDAAALAEAPAGYRPDTLSERLRRVGRLPINECIGIARALGLALEHLHAHGLIHRDVKPSNVVFVDGVLKLADVGLVSARDATLSLVGTEGYIPREGPGTVRADLFGMGKTLYEISSGLDRMEFPAVPEWVCDQPGDGRWSEFNEIVLKCCAKDPDQRYASARELLSDLAWLEEGRSLVKRRRVRSLWHGTKLGAVTVLLAGALFALGAVVNPWRGRPAAPPTEHTNLVSTLLNLDPLELPIHRSRHREWDFSPGGGLLAVSSHGEIVIRDQQLRRNRRVPAENPEGWELSNPRFVGNRRDLLCLGERFGDDPTGPEEMAILLLDAEERSIKRVIYRSAGILNRLSVSVATREIAVRAVLAEGEPQGLLGGSLDDGSMVVWDEDPGLGVGEFSPDGTWLALYPRWTEIGGKEISDVWLFNVKDGRKVQITESRGFAGHPAWSADGRELYYVAGKSLNQDATLSLWKVSIDAQSGRPRGAPEPLLLQEDSQVLFPSVIPETGELVVALVKQDVTVMVAPTTDLAQALHVVTAVPPVMLSRDGNWIYYADHRTASEGVYRNSTTDPPRREALTAKPALGFDVSPGGDGLAVLERSGGGLSLSVVSPADGTSREIARLSGVEGASVRWSPDGEWLAFTDGPDLFVIKASGGVPRKLATVFDWIENVWEGTLAWSPDGSMVAAYGYPDAESDAKELNHLFVVEVATGELRSLADTEADGYYKEGLRWHPEGDRISYMVYGPGRDSQIRVAYPDGRSSDLLVNQDHHWDWVGTWHPNKTDFLFAGFGREHQSSFTHVLRIESGEIVHADGPIQVTNLLPQWSADAKTVMWAESTGSRQLMLLKEK